MVLSALDSIALLLAMTAGFAYFNHYVFGLPRNIGLLVVALIVSLGLRLLDYALPELGFAAALRQALARIDFGSLLLDGFIGFLLFAGALQVDVQNLLARKWTILALATMGVLLSTMMIGAGIWGVFRFVGIAMPANYCLAFGALLSPTDPVTILGILRRLGIPPRLQAVIAGESLFNDAMGIVLYSLFLGEGRDFEESGLAASAAFLLKLLREGGGGLVLGFVTGTLAFLATRGIDEYNIELMISLALVTGTYGIAQAIGVSGPVAEGIAGLMMGSIGVRYAVSGATHDYLQRFWSLTDEVLNALLFLLIGLEFAAIPLEWSYVAAAGLAIPLALVVRCISVTLPGFPVNLQAPRKLRAIALLTWSGLRGGISVALALSLPPGDFREPLLAACYGTVIFTMIVQGLTLHRVAARLFPAEKQS